MYSQMLMLKSSLFERAVECGFVEAKYNLARQLTVGSNNGNQAVDLKCSMRLLRKWC